jgi:hypothetical protein
MDQRTAYRSVGGHGVVRLACYYGKVIMSQAFVKESDEQWLHEVAPTLNALIVYLTRENNGIRVYEQRSYLDEKTGKEIHVMSNGMSYTKDEAGKWYII